jgi:CheY-like chemotaxis protein
LQKGNHEVIKYLILRIEIIHKTVPLKLPSRTGSTAAYKFVLLGEDDADDEELLREVFSTIDNSFSLVFVNNGRKLIASLECLGDHELPCLIILDYNMPELNGAEILAKLKVIKRYDSIPKIIWSTSGSDTYKRVCLELGACEYLIKPSNVSSLTDTARYMLSFCPIEK